MRVANIFPVWVLFFHSDINILKFLNILKYLCIWLHWVLAAAFEIFHLHCSMRFPGGSDGKVSVYNAGDLGSIPGSGRFPGEGNGNPRPYSCLENPMDGGAWFRLLSMGSQRVGLNWATSLHLWTLSCCMWNLVPWPGIEPKLGVQQLSQWTTREVSKNIFFKAVLDLDEV